VFIVTVLWKTANTVSGLKMDPSKICDTRSPVGIGLDGEEEKTERRRHLLIIVCPEKPHVNRKLGIPKRRMTASVIVIRDQLYL